MKKPIDVICRGLKSTYNLLGMVAALFIFVNLFFFVTSVAVFGLIEPVSHGSVQAAHEFQTECKKGGGNIVQMDTKSYCMSGDTGDEIVETHTPERKTVGEIFREISGWPPYFRFWV